MLVTDVGYGAKVNGIKTILYSVMYKGDPDYFICSDNWSNTLSNIVCKQMGYEYGNLLYVLRLIQAEFFMEVMIS